MNIGDICFFENWSDQFLLPGCCFLPSLCLKLSQTPCPARPCESLACRQRCCKYLYLHHPDTMDGKKSPVPAKDCDSLCLSPAGSL